MKSLPCSAVVIGASAGGFEALRSILSGLGGPLTKKVAVAMHLPEGGFDFTHLFPDSDKYVVKEAVHGAKMEFGVVWFAPSGYHLLIESDETLSLDVSAKVNHARPSIDVLFETASDVYGDGLLGVLLSGGGKDGVVGLKYIKTNGGIVVAQDPEMAEVPFLPRLAAQSLPLDGVCNLETLSEMFSHA